MKNENSKDNWSSYRSSLTVSGPQQKHWAIPPFGKSYKLRSVCYPPLRKRRFQRQQSCDGQNSGPRRTRRRRLPDGIWDGIVPHFIDRTDIEKVSRFECRPSQQSIPVFCRIPVTFFHLAGVT